MNRKISSPFTVLELTVLLLIVIIVLTLVMGAFVEPT